MKSTVRRLEQVLRVWEDWSFMLKVGAQICQAERKQLLAPLEGPVIHAHTFRRYLLEFKEGQIFDHEKFIGPAKVQEHYQSLGPLPLSLLSWSLQSRRVFTLTQELQGLLAATSLEGVTWKDVSLPFGGFGVQLAKPIQDDKESAEYDFILFSNMGTLQREIITEIRLLPTSLDSYPFIDSTVKEDIAKAIKRRKWDVARRKLMKVCDSRRQSIVGGRFAWFNDSVHDALVTESLKTVSERAAQTGFSIGGNAGSDVDLAARLVVGLCLYLKMLPSGSPHQSEWKPVPKQDRKDLSFVTSEAEVCTVSSCHKLTVEEKAALNMAGHGRSLSGREVRAHFRRGHWRRLPGYGGQTGSPKLTWVRPTLVRRDRLPKGARPGGTETVIGG